MMRLLVKQLSEALRACHNAGFVHGSFSLQHCVRIGDSYGGRWKVCQHPLQPQPRTLRRGRSLTCPSSLPQLADLAGAASFTRGEFVTDHVAVPFVPPELLYVDDEGQMRLKVVAEKGVLEVRGRRRAATPSRCGVGLR